MTSKINSKRRESANHRFVPLAEASRRLLEAQAPGQVASAAKALLAALGDPAELVREVERTARDADAALRRSLLSLETDLRSACTCRTWSLDSVWPTFFIEKAIEVAIDESGGVVRVAGQRVGMDVEAIVEAASPLVRQLLPRNFSPDGFLQSVAAALDVVTTPGGSAAIGQVYRQLVIDAQSSRFWRDAKSESFVPLSLEQFRARLSKTLASDTMLQDGRVLRFSPPLNANDGVFLWQPAEHRFGYVGRLQLVREARP